jgi:hypothetical protein
MSSNPNKKTAVAKNCNFHKTCHKWEMFGYTWSTGRQETRLGGAPEPPTKHRQHLIAYWPPGWGDNSPSWQSQSYMYSIPPGDTQASAMVWLVNMESGMRATVADSGRAVAANNSATAGSEEKIWTRRRKRGTSPPPVQGTARWEKSADRTGGVP